MPLSELIRNFNAADSTGGTLYQQGGRVVAWRDGLHLASLFAPIVDLRHERVVGHQASLAARLEDGSMVSNDNVYARSATPASIVPFDRLVRTLHALNFLPQRGHVGGFLLLSVHARHLRAVRQQHGLVFEAILKRCGLAPEDIVLELDHHELDGCGHLASAVDSYRSRGYRLALRGVDQPLAAMQALQLAPDIVRLAGDPTQETSAVLRHGQATLLQSGIASGRDYAAARAAAVELGQGSLFGDARGDCRATHAVGRVAYNGSSSFGVSA